MTQFAVAKKELVSALTAAERVADSRSTMPILSNVLLDASAPAAVRVAATDLYQEFTTLVQAKVKTPGSIALPARPLLERVKALPDGEVKIAVKDSTATITVAGSPRRFTLAGIDGAEFPPLPAPSTDGISVPASTLREILAQTHFAISADESRPHLNSLLLELGSDALAVSTDGHRLAKTSAPLGASESLRFTLPLKAVTELRRIVESAGEESILLSRVSPNVFFTLGSTTFGAKETDAKFPPYDQVIPKAYEYRFRVSRSMLADAIRSAAIVAGESSASKDNKAGGGIKLAGDGSKLVISSENPMSEAHDEIPCEAPAGLVVGLSARYMLDVLGCLESDEVTIQTSGGTEPFVITSGESLFVVMPMRL